MLLLPSRQALVTLWVLTLAGLQSGCVKQSEYEALQQENQQLQMRLDQASEQVRQVQADLATQQARVLQLLDVQTKLQKSQEQLQQALAELDALKAEFETFRTQRRSAMMGRKYPVLQLDDGNSLKDAVLTSVSADEVAIRHDGGFMKIALADTNADLRWEACYDPLEAKKQQRERMLAEARLLDAALAKRRNEPVSAASGPTAQAVSLVQQLTLLISEQRRRLNAEFEVLRAQTPSLSRDNVWNSAAPEASPLLNSVSGSRAVLGISRLQSLRDAINQSLQQLRQLDPKAR